MAISCKLYRVSCEILCSRRYFIRMFSTCVESRGCRTGMCDYGGSFVIDDLYTCEVVALEH